MQGSMRERKPGVWEIRVYRGKDPVTHRDRYTSHTLRGGRRAAESERARLVAAAGTAAATEATLGLLLDQWLEVHGPELSPTTLYNYRKLVDNRIKPGVGDVVLKKLNAEHLDRLYRSLVASGLSPRTVKQVHSIIRRALQIGTQWGWVPLNVAQAATPPKARNRSIDPPSAREVRSVLASTADYDPELAVFMRLAFATGARRGEVCALRWQDFNERTGTVHITRNIVLVPGKGLVEKTPKTERSDRIVSLDTGTLQALADHAKVMAERAAMAGTKITERSFLFSRAPDCMTPMHPSYATKAFRKVADSLGLPNARLHDLRHANATQLLDAGYPVATVSKRLGHASSAMTHDVYGHAIPERDEAAARTLGDLLDGPRNELET